MNRFNKLATVCCALQGAFVFPALAGYQPSFHLESLAWQASDIALVSGDAGRAGKCLVIEAWKGKLKAGDTVTIPELAAFASDDSRAIHRWPREAATNLPTRVSASRMCLFLRKTASGSWGAADKTGGMKTAVAWIEENQAYAFVQEMNPGPSLLVPLRLSEAEMKAQVSDVVQTQDALARTVAITSLSQRAEALKPFISSKHWFARKEGFAELGKCGGAALPVLRGLLDDESLLAQHGDVIGALGQAGGANVAAELTALVEAETRFWKQTAPKLKQGWWNGAGFQGPAEWSRVELLRNRYVKLGAAIGVLDGLRYNGCKTAVTQLRDVWRSYPQLEEVGLGQMSQGCDHLLKTLQ
jgi:hypothetical protein